MAYCCLEAGPRGWLCAQEAVKSGVRCLGQYVWETWRIGGRWLNRWAHRRRLQLGQVEAGVRNLSCARAHSDICNCSGVTVF